MKKITHAEFLDMGIHETWDHIKALQTELDKKSVPSGSEIQVAGGRLTIVDDDDYELLSMFSWMKKGKYIYKKERVNGKDVYTSMSRMIMNCPDGKLVDHINGNKLDNRRSNLRVCDMYQNSMNRGKTKGNTSGFKGVTFNKNAGKWQSIITAYKKRYYLGLFTDPKKAYEAYISKAIELHGEFVNIGEQQ